MMILWKYRAFIATALFILAPTAFLLIIIIVKTKSKNDSFE